MEVSIMLKILEVLQMLTVYLFLPCPEFSEEAKDLSFKEADAQGK